MRYLQPGDLVTRDDAPTASGFRIVERIHPLDQESPVDPRSAVYLARDEAGGLGEVVLKFPNWEPGEEEAHVERLRAAARRLTRLVHPNVARVHDVCFDADGRLFFVLEYVDGSPLRSLHGTLYGALNRDGDESFGAMSVGEFVPLASQLAEALAGAHRQGLLWCDVKPGNALVTRDPGGRKLLKLIDPGEVRAIDRPDDLTGSTPENVAPERRGVGPSSLAEGHAASGRAPASRRTEVYELGLVFYEMLTGKRGDEAGVALRDALERPDLPPGLRSLIRTMLEVDPRRRCPSMAEVVRRLAALEAVAGERTITLDVAPLTQTIRLDDTLGAQAVRALVFGDYDRVVFLHYTSQVLEVVALDADEIAVPRATSYTLDLRSGYLAHEGESRPLQALFEQIDWSRVSVLGPRDPDADWPSPRLDARSTIGKALLLGMDQLYDDHALRGREGIVFVLLDQPGDSDEERAIQGSLGSVLQEAYYPPLRREEPQRARGSGRVRLADAVDECLRTAPLRYPYVLGTATWSGSEYVIDSREVFGLSRRASGAGRRPAVPPRQVITLQSPSGADQHVLLALFAKVDDRPLAEQPLVQATWAYLRGGESYTLGLTLERAGRVELACVDAEESFLVSLPTPDGWEGELPTSEWLRVPEDRALVERHVRDQIARVEPIEDEWQRIRPRPVQICLILDSIGDQAAIDERRRVAVECLQGLKRLPERARFRIALVAYGDHRHVERVAYDEPEVYLEHDFGTIDQAITRLAQLRPLEGQDFEGCFEDAFQRASGFGWRHDAARALVAIVNRPPHPVEVEYRRGEPGQSIVYDQIACPAGVDWEAELEALDGAGVGELLSFVLLCPQHWKLLRWAWVDTGDPSARDPNAIGLGFDPDQPVEKDPPPHASAYRQAFLEGLARTRLIELQPDSAGHLRLPADLVEMIGRTVAAPPLPSLADP